MGVGTKIKEARLAKAITQQQLADALNVARSTVSGWEVGRNEPDLESCVQICQLLKVSLNDLLGATPTAKELSINDRPLFEKRPFTFVDEFGNTIYEVVDKSLLPTPKIFHILDIRGKKIGEIYQSRLHSFPRFRIGIDGYGKILIQKDIREFKTYYSIDSKELAITGNWLSKNFGIVKNGIEIAKVCQGTPIWEVGYHLTILDLSLEPLIIGLIATMILVQNFEVPYMEK